MNGPAVFLSYTSTDEAAVGVIDQALRDRGLTVFRDKDIHLFDGVADNVRRALDSSAVLVAFYSRRYPARFSCQWELTRAFLAAQRLGDPRDRVLIVNPEPDDLHIASGDLLDAGYFSWVNDSDATRLADAVAAKVGQAAGPLGGMPDGGPGQFPGNLSVPRRFAGRYSVMWSIHGELHSHRPWAARRPESHAAVVVAAPTGMGKTVLAEQYSLVFQDAYPGGVVWTSMAGASQAAGFFAATVNEVARERFGLDVSGMRPRQANATLADRIVSDVLWVIDDVPAGLDPQRLNAFLIPSPQVHTLLTMRTAPQRWPGGSVTLAGLTAVEAEELCRAQWPSLPRDECAAISRRVAGREVRPLEILPEAQRLRGAQGGRAFARTGDGTRHSVVDSLLDVVQSRSRHARALLGFASVLAPAPIKGETLVCGVSDLLGLQAPTLVAEALDELNEHGLLNRVTGTAKQFWRLPAVVASAIHRDLDQVVMSSFAERAARILVNGLSDASLDTCTHALELASNVLVPLSVRRSLVRAVAALHEQRGDILAAREARDRALAVARDEWQIEDAEAAARLAVAVGEARDALRHTDMLVDRARAERDIRSEFQARLIAATAHDVLGDYTTANETFHHHALVREHGPTPVWLSDVDRQQVGLARVRALRLRGEYLAARQVIDGLLPAIQQAHPQGTHRGAWPILTVELARLQLSRGQVVEAQATAQRVLSAFSVAGATRHQLAREAVAVLVEGDLTMALVQTSHGPERWIHVTEQVRQELARSTEWYGSDSPLTLELMVLHGRALTNCGELGEALGVLAEAERRTAAVLGGEHPLALRARQWAGVATIGRGEWKAAAAVFERLLPRQVSALGRDHPESQLTRFQLGVCLLRQNNWKRARPLLGEATPALRELYGPVHRWATTPGAGWALTRVPGPLLRIIGFLAGAGGKD